MMLCVKINKKMLITKKKRIYSYQGRIIHRRDWATALGHQPIGRHQVIIIMTRPLYIFHVLYIYYFEEMQMHRK